MKVLPPLADPLCVLTGMQVLRDSRIDDDTDLQTRPTQSESDS